MKRFISVILAGVLILSLCSCGAKESELYAMYSDDTNVVNTDIGEYVIGQTMPLLTEGKICIIDSASLSADENLHCKAALVVDITHNKFIQGQDIYTSIYPASVTKLLTALLIFKYGNLDDTYTIKEDNCGITEAGAQLMGFKKGDVITIKDLLYCLLLYSGNDSATALADYLSGSDAEFATLMNEEAKKLGCTGTHFTNPHGLHDVNHYTTAYDQYMILRHLMDYEMFVTISSTVDYEFTYTNAAGEYLTMPVTTTNKFKKGVYSLPEGVSIVGAKTGNTYAAGTCLIQCVETSDGTRYIIAVFGAEDQQSLYEQHQYLSSMVEGISN